MRFTALMLTLIFILGAFLASCGKENEKKTAPTTTAAPTEATTTATKSNAIIVPDVIGKTESEAVSELKGLGLEVFVSYKDNDETEKGIVFKIDRQIGQELKKGDKIFVYVSNGKSQSFDDPKVDKIHAAIQTTADDGSKIYTDLRTGKDIILGRQRRRLFRVRPDTSLRRCIRSPYWSR